MATGDKYIACESTTGRLLTISSGALELLNALVVKTAAGKYGLRTVTTTTAAANISNVVTCSTDLMDFETLLKNIIVESASGKPAIGLVAES